VLLAPFSACLGLPRPDLDLCLMSPLVVVVVVARCRTLARYAAT